MHQKLLGCSTDDCVGRMFGTVALSTDMALIGCETSNAPASYQD